VVPLLESAIWYRMANMKRPSTANTERTGFSALSRTALRHEVAKSLVTAIFERRIPANSRLVVQKLAAQFGVSATPVREALLELEVIGIIETTHNRGAVVKHFGRQELRDIFHLRRVLECEAVRCACGRIDSARLAELREGVCDLRDKAGQESSWSNSAMEQDIRFHGLISSHCGNPRLANEIERYSAIVEVVREVMGNKWDMQRRAVDDHLAIVDALLAEDAEAAAMAMAAHIDQTAKMVCDAMFPGEE